MHTHHQWFATGALTALFAATPIVTQAQTKAEFEALRTKVEALEDRLAESEGLKKSSAADVIKLSDSVTELKLYGDLRLRYQYDNLDDQIARADSSNPNGRDRNDSQRSRYRFRLRLNADFKLQGGFFGGVRLQTSENSDSADQTYEDGFKNYGIFISRAYLGWKNEWLTVTGGKVPNPFYTTDLVWDNDINPTGLTQSVRFHELFGSERSVESYSKDGKSVASTEAVKPPWEVTLNLGEFIYDDNPEGAFDNDASDDAYIIAGQLVATYKFSKDFSATIAPGVMLFNAADLSGFSNAGAFSDASGVSGESRKLTIITAPGDVSFKLGSVATKFYWDFAYNTQGQGRVDDIYQVLSVRPDGEIRSKHQSVDDFAFLVGVEFGKLKKAGDWSVNLNYRQTGIAAVDPNLNDSTFALSFLNTRGPQIGVAYNVTDFLTASVIYSKAWNLRDNLFGGQATGGAGIAPGNSIDVLQVDLNVKF